MLVTAIIELYDMYLSIYLYGFLSIVYSMVISYLVFFEIYICVIETSLMKPTFKESFADVFSFSVYY